MTATRSSPSSFSFTFGAAFAAFAVVVAVAGVLHAARQGPRAPFDRVVLLGFDGTMPAVVEHLAAEGRLPAIKRLMDEGAYGHLRTFHPNKSAILWTSIATGKTMVKHGIVDWTYLDEHGIEVPYKDRARRAKAYWEILSERGLPTGTINWWVSYPPRPVPSGFVVSNAFRHRTQPDTVYPQSLFPEIAPLVLDEAAAAAEMPGLGLTRWREEDASFPLVGVRNLVVSYPLYVAHDLTVDRVSDQLWKTHPVRVFSTYFRLPDVTGHLASNYMNRELALEAAAREREGTLDAATVERTDREFARVLAPVYEWMDRVIAKWLQRVDDGRTLLIVCSDHGFRYVNGGYYHAPKSVDPPDGVIFLRGPGVKHTRIQGASLLDVAPTILYAMGQPQPRDMDGTALRAVLDEALAARFPLRTIATYETGARAGAAAGSGDVDEKVMEDLRALGYIEAREK